MRFTPRRGHAAGTAAILFMSVSALLLTACGDSSGNSAGATTASAAPASSAAPLTSAPSPQESVTSAAPTPSPTPSAPAQTSAAANAPGDLSERQVLDLLLTPEELARAGKQPKGRFEDKFTQVKQGPSAYTALQVTPARCREFAEGPFAGVSPRPDGAITWSAQRVLLEGEPSTYRGMPVNVIQSLQVFTSAAAAEEAFERIAAEAASCRAYTYEDDQGVIEKKWVDAWVTRSSDANLLYQDTVAMFDKVTTRFIALDGSVISALSVTSGNAMKSDEIDRFEDLAQLARDRVRATQG